jgi:protein SCO1
MKWLFAITFLICGFSTPMLAGTAPQRPPSLQNIGIEQWLNATIPLDIPFRDEQGAEVQLRKFFQGRPVLLVPVYYTCPMLCSQVLSGVVAGLRPLSLIPGRDFEIVAFSFNPSETPADATRERDLYTRRYSKRAGVAGWHFLTGQPQSIKALTDAIGFHYRYDSALKIFVHGSGVMVLTPEGKISRYFYGVEYEPKDLKLGLVEASSGKIGSPADQILLFCYHYDPTTGKYTTKVLALLRLAAILTLLLMAIGFVFYWRVERRRNARIHLREVSQR